MRLIYESQLLTVGKEFFLELRRLNKQLSHLKQGKKSPTKGRHFLSGNTEIVFQMKNVINR